MYRVGRSRLEEWEDYLCWLDMDTQLSFSLSVCCMVRTVPKPDDNHARYLSQSDDRGPLERDVQTFLASNLAFAFGEPLTLVGTEHPVPFGRAPSRSQ